MKEGDLVVHKKMKGIFFVRSKKSHYVELESTLSGRKWFCLDDSLSPAKHVIAKLFL